MSISCEGGGSGEGRGEPKLEGGLCGEDNVGKNIPGIEDLREKVLEAGTEHAV